MPREEAAKFLTEFDSEGRFVRDGKPQYGLFNFVLQDNGDLYIFRPGSNYIHLREDSYRHTFPVRAEPGAAMGEMFFSVSGRLVAINAKTGHYLINPGLSNSQIKQELEKRKIPTQPILFFDIDFPNLSQLPQTQI